MKRTITSFVGLDVHKDTIAVAVAEAGREEPRFVGLKFSLDLILR
ncbi:MAG: hypothetical protein ACREUT_08360 [Steroidobacteraceae bacterium]